MLNTTFYSGGLLIYIGEHSSAFVGTKSYTNLKLASGAVGCVLSGEEEGRRTYAQNDVSHNPNRLKRFKFNKILTHKTGVLEGGEKYDYGHNKELFTNQSEFPLYLPQFCEASRE